MQRIIPLIILFVPLVGIGQIGVKAQQGKIYDIWQNNDFGYQMTLMLNADGTGEFDGEEIKFSIEANKLSITQQGVTNNYTYALQGNSLTLSGGDIEKPITFKRNGANQQAQETKPEVAISSAPRGAGSPIPANLLGVWSGNNETIEFKNSGECIYNGQLIKYQLSANNITIQGTQGTAVIAYAVNGDKLLLTINGQNFTYTKGKGGNAAATSPAGKGQVAQELAGKWCYMKVSTSGTGGSYSDECFTLKADGTYEYYSESSRSVNTSDMYRGTSSQGSDRGTWTYDGVRLYCNSYTKGNSSYQLEKRNHPKTGDPMIVLNGYTYVTYYNKSPW